MNGVTTKYTLFGDKVAFETTGPDKIHYSYDASGNLFSMNLNGTEYYYVRNVQGDITGLIDNAGNLVVSYTYETWGKMIATTGSLASTIGVKNPYRYRGYRYDNETGLYYIQSRYYNPEWGRFINADGITGVEGELLTHNMFAYCVNNPVNMQDLSGFLHQYASYSSIIISTIAGMIKVGLVSILSASILPYIAIGVIVVGGVSYYNIKQTLAVQREATRIKATIKPNSKNRYWGANLSWKGVTLGKPLTLDQAISEVKVGRNVFAVTKSEARIVAQAASTHPVCDPEIDKGKEIVTGYYYHFHTNVKNGAHVWYLFNY